MCSNYCFSTATVVKRTRLNVRLCVCCMDCHSRIAEDKGTGGCEPCKGICRQKVLYCAVLERREASTPHSIGLNTLSSELQRKCTGVFRLCKIRKWRLVLRVSFTFRKNQEFVWPTLCRGGKLLLFGDQFELFDAIKRSEDSTVENYVLEGFSLFNSYRCCFEGR